MPIGKLLGYRKTSFQGDNGDTVSGHTIFVGSDIPAGSGVGMSVDRVFVHDNYHVDFSQFAVGDRVLLDFNSRGKFAALTKLK